MPKTTWTQRGAAGICLVSLGTIGVFAGSSYSAVEVASRAMETVNSPARDLAGQSLTGSGAAGFETRSTAANYESDSRDFDLELGVNEFCGPDGDFEACATAYIGGGGSGSPEACPGLWATSTSATPGSTQPSISTANPNGGLKHLHFEFDINQPSTDTARNWAFSFDLPAIGVDPDWARPLGTITRLSLDVYVSATGGQNTFIIQPQAGDEGLLTTLLQMPGSGSLVVGDTDATAPEGSFFIVTTDAVWEPGSY
ncbi:MAG: hypothetical protein KJO44_09680, partial [Gemmatimonadetes bacterium]|nr:hypothetical protein [Gemmatimonadota bacterium]